MGNCISLLVQKFIVLLNRVQNVLYDNYYYFVFVIENCCHWSRPDSLLFPFVWKKNAVEHFYRNTCRQLKCDCQYGKELIGAYCWHVWSGGLRPVLFVAVQIQATQVCVYVTAVDRRFSEIFRRWWLHWIAQTWPRRWIGFGNNQQFPPAHRQVPVLLNFQHVFLHVLQANRFRSGCFSTVTIWRRRWGTSTKSSRFDTILILFLLTRKTEDISNNR